jgi:hypothetical protein
MAEMTTTAPTPRSVEFEEFMAGMRKIEKMQEETALQMKENARLQREADRRMEESKEEFDQLIKESKRKYDKRMKDFDRRFGDFTNRFGEVVEYMIAPNLREKFKEFGLSFPQTSTDAYIDDYENNIFLEIDVLLQNGDKAMLVEIKTKLTTEDVKDHVKRLEKMRAYANIRGDRRIFLGAVAGVVMTPYAKKYALKQGFYVIEPSGETFNITPPDGKPREW